MACSFVVMSGRIGRTDVATSPAAARPRVAGSVHRWTVGPRPGRRLRSLVGASGPGTRATCRHAPQSPRRRSRQAGSGQGVLRSGHPRFQRALFELLVFLRASACLYASVFWDSSIMSTRRTFLSASFNRAQRFWASRRRLHFASRSWASPLSATSGVAGAAALRFRHRPRRMTGTRGR